MYPETEPDLSMAIHEGLKASEIHTQQGIERRFGKTGNLEYSNSLYDMTVINSAELKSPRFAGCLLSIVRSYGPSKKDEKIPIAGAISTSFVGGELELYYRDQRANSVLSTKEIKDFAESLEGMSATGELGLNFEVGQRTETDEGAVKKETINLHQFTDFSGNFVDVTVELDIGFAGPSEATLDNFEQIVGQAAKGNFKPARSPYMIRAIVSSGSKTDFDQDDPEQAKKLSRGISIALKVLEMVLHKTDSKSREIIKLEPRMVRDILEINKTNPPNINWLVDLYGKEDNQEEGED